MYGPSPGTKRAAVVAGGKRCWKVADSRGSAVCINSVAGDECKVRFCTIDSPLTHYQNMSAGNSTYILGDGRDGFHRDRPPCNPSHRHSRQAVEGLKYFLDFWNPSVQYQHTSIFIALLCWEGGPHGVLCQFVSAYIRSLQLIPVLRKE